MADIFQEVDEDLRRDKAAEWWKKHSLYIYAVAAVVVIAVAGYQGWRTYDLKLRGERSDSYAAAIAMLDAGNEADAKNALQALADPAGSGYPLLAAFTQAQLAAEAGDLATADNIWQGIAREASSESLRQLASLYSVMYRLESDDPASLRGELQSLAAEGAPYRFTALELLAALALREGDKAAARDHLVKITDDPAAPSGSRSRAAELLASLPG